MAFTKALQVASLVLLTRASVQVGIDLCKKPTGNFGRENEDPSEVWKLSQNGCMVEGNVILLKLTAVEYMQTLTGSCRANVVISGVPDRELCKYDEGSCIFILPVNATCVNLSSAGKDCTSFDHYYVNEEIVSSITVHYQVDSPTVWWPTFQIEYNRLASDRSNGEGSVHPGIQAATTTDFTTVQADTTQSQAGNDGTIKPKLTTTEKSTSQISQLPGQQCASNSSTERILAIVFGILFAVTLTTLIMVLLRFRANDIDENENAESLIDSTHASNSKERHPASERQIVVNELYEMS